MRNKMKKQTKNHILLGIIVVIALFFSFKISNDKEVFNPSLSPSSTQTQITKPDNEETSQTPIHSSPPESATMTPTINQTEISTCRDGDVVRQNVKPCIEDLECYSLTPMNERYCRLPDGTCKFFCTDK